MSAHSSWKGHLAYGWESRNLNQSGLPLFALPNPDGSVYGVMPPMPYGHYLLMVLIGSLTFTPAPKLEVINSIKSVDGDVRFESTKLGQEGQGT